jgi:hypothetical protein
LLRFLAVRLAGLTCGAVAAASFVMAALGMFHGDMPLGIVLGAALGFGRLYMTGRLLPLIMRRGKTAVAVANQFGGLALMAGFLVFCIKQSVWLFAGGAAGFLLIPAVIVMNRKRSADLFMGE